MTTVTVAANVVAYSETGLAPSTMYYYRVRATNASGDSANTPTPPTLVSATTLGSIPTAPSSLTATTASSSQINLGWQDNSNNETGFKIDQSTTSDFSSGVTTTTVGANVVAYSETGLRPRHVLLSRAGHQRLGRLCQHTHGQRHHHRGRRYDLSGRKWILDRLGLDRKRRPGVVAGQ